MLAYAPWIFLVIENKETGKGLAQNIGWVARPTLWDIAQFFALLNKPFWFIQSTAARPYDLLTAFFALLVVGAPLVVLGMRFWRLAKPLNDVNAQPFRAMFLFAWAPLAIVFGLSWLLPQSVWGTRHLIIVAAPYAILVSVAIIRLPVKWMRIAVCRKRMGGGPPCALHLVCLGAARPASRDDRGRIHARHSRLCF
jgi:hypothetical protein